MRCSIKPNPCKNFSKRAWAARPRSRSTSRAVTPPWWSRLRFGHAQVAFMSAWPAQLAVRLGGAEVALAEIREVLHGKEKVEAPYYFSYWVVAPDSPYKDLQSLKGKSACFPSPISTSGFVAPMGRIVEMNLIPTRRRQRSRPQSFFQGRAVRRRLRPVLAGAQTRPGGYHGDRRRRAREALQ